MRHAANVGGCYSTTTICLAHDVLENQQFTDDLVRNRLAHAEFSKEELNPLQLGVPSVAEHVSVPVLNSMLRGMRGVFTPDEAHHFTDYHIKECDYETLRLIADHTSFTNAERREFFELTDWMANPVFAPGATSTTPVRATNSKPASPKRKTGMAKALLFAALVIVGILAVIALGAFAIIGVAVVAVIALVAAGSSGDSSQADKFPDARSDYNRRVWAAEHNYDADGDDSHNYEADGDYPW